jgi:hypothetical protein
MSTVETFTVDTHEISQLTADLIKAAPLAVLKVEPAVKKGAQNIKKAMQADAKGHLITYGEGGRRIDPHLERVINYDINVHEFGGDASVDAEIGYDKHAGGSAALAGIAIFGTSRPGGGTVRNPVEALNDEAPNLERALGAIGDGILI